jgi:hypothetical protein
MPTAAVSVFQGGEVVGSWNLAAGFPQSVNFKAAGKNYHCICCFLRNRFDIRLSLTILPRWKSIFAPIFHASMSPSAKREVLSLCSELPMRYVDLARSAQVFRSLLSKGSCGTRARSSSP